MLGGLESMTQRAFGRSVKNFWRHKICRMGFKQTSDLTGKVGHIATVCPVLGQMIDLLTSLNKTPLLPAMIRYDRKRLFRRPKST